MRNRILILASLVALAVMSSARVAQAQQRITVNIPFDFVAGNTALPAGEYSVNVLGQQKSFLRVENKQAAAALLISTNAIISNVPQSATKLVFNRYGDRYFLAQVWTEGAQSGRQLSKSSREKELALYAKTDTQNQVTLVAELSTTNR